MIVTQEQSLTVYIPESELVEVLSKAGYPFPKRVQYKVGYVGPEGPRTQGGLMVIWTKRKRVGT